MVESFLYVIKYISPHSTYYNLSIGLFRSDYIYLFFCIVFDIDWKHVCVLLVSNIDVSHSMTSNFIDDRTPMEYIKYKRDKDIVIFKRKIINIWTNLHLFFKCSFIFSQWIRIHSHHVPRIRIGCAPLILKEKFLPQCGAHSTANNFQYFFPSMWKQRMYILYIMIYEQTFRSITLTANLTLALYKYFSS